MFIIICCLFILATDATAVYFVIVEWINLEGCLIQAIFSLKIILSFKFIKIERKFPCCVKVIALFNNHGRLVIIDNKFQKKKLPT